MVGGEFEPEELMEGGDAPRRRAANGNPKNDGRGSPRSVRPAGDRRPVQQYDPDDFTKPDRDDGEILAAQTQHRKPKKNPETRRYQTGKRQCFPKGEIEVARQQGKSIGAYRVKGDVAEIEQTGEPDDDIETPAEHHVDQHGRPQVDQIARRKRQERQRDAERDPCERDRQHLTIGPDGKTAERRRATGCTAAIELRVETQHKAAGKDCRGADRNPIEMRANAERAAADIVGLQADQRQGEKNCHQRRQRSVFEKRRPVDGRTSGFVDGEPGGSRHQTFSTSGRPSRPVGRKTSTRIRTTKTETSLYSTEK